MATPHKTPLYGHLPPITKTIQVRRTRHAGHCWRSRDVLLWTPTHGRAKAGRPARTYIQQLCEDTGCCPEDLPRAMNDREEWRERVRDIRATSATWWWWNVVCLNNLYLSFALGHINNNISHHSVVKANCMTESAKTNADGNYTDDLVLLRNGPAKAKCHLHSLEQAARGFGLHRTQIKQNSWVLKKMESSPH